MLLVILALIDVHTLFVLVFHSFLPASYIFAGSTFLFAKGIIFYLPSRDVFSLIDIIISLTMLLLLVTPLWTWLYWVIGLYLGYKIALSFMSF